MATTGIIKGRVMSIYIGGVLLEDQLDSSFTRTQDVSEITTKESAGQHKEYQADYNDGTGNVSGYLAFDATEGVSEALTYVTNGTAVTVLWDNNVTGDSTYSNSAIVTSCQVSFPKDGPATYSIDFQFTGNFTEGTN